jgi:hypothetical protein
MRYHPDQGAILGGHMRRLGWRDEKEEKKGNMKTVVVAVVVVIVMVNSKLTPAPSYALGLKDEGTKLMEPMER